MKAATPIDPGDVWRARRSGKKLLRAQSTYREDYVRDRARVIHSAGFRRLQAKTQVLGIGEGDFHRTRLTHSMEVAQIARGIVRHLKEIGRSGAPWESWLPSQNLIETIALCHDLGHPPFGHGGETALNFVMRSAGGFEGNGQTLRLLARLEAHTEEFGLDLTRRSMLGLLKYPVIYERVVRRKLSPIPKKISQVKRDDWKPPKCYMTTEQDVVEWVLDPLEKSDRKAFIELRTKPTDRKHGKSAHHAFDTSIMELADDIAYGVHDFEDAIALRLVDRQDWNYIAAAIIPAWGKTVDLEASDAVGDALFDGSSAARKRAVGGLVNAFVVSIRVMELERFRHPLLRYQAELATEATAMLDRLKEIVIKKVIKIPQVQTLEYRGQQLIIELFDALASDPERLLKENFGNLSRAATSEDERKRILCDYIAGMTDEYATRLFERLFIPRHGQFSDRL